MSYRELEDYYKKRRELISAKINDDLLVKFYFRLQKGSEIRYEDTKSFLGPENKIRDILIDIQQEKIVKRDLKRILDQVRMLNEVGIKIVYGDYGHGKSQMANILVEWFKDEDKNILAYLENITTLRDFIENYAKYAQTFLLNNAEHLLFDGQQYLSILLEAQNPENSLTTLRQNFINFAKYMSKNSHTIVLFLDELDKVARDPIELQHWIDLFISLNDENSLGIVLVILIPQITTNTLLQTDTRMERWNNFFSLDATQLDGKYGSVTLKGIANILAISTHYNYFEIQDDGLNFVYDLYTYKKDYLQNASLRNVNTWAVSVSEFLIQADSKFELWEKKRGFLALDEIEQEKIIERKLKIYLAEDQLPHFEVFLEDLAEEGEEEEKEVYRVRYNPEKLRVDEEFSDGHFEQLVNYKNTETLKHKVAITINYNLDVANQESQIDRITKIANNYPVLFFSIGPDKNTGKMIQTLFDRLCAKDRYKYPIKVINIPTNLVYPLLILPNDSKDKSFPFILQLLITWAKIMTGHRDEITYFLKELPNLMSQRTITLRSYELAGIPIKQIQEDENITETLIDKEQEIEKGKLFLSAMVISMLENVQSFKYYTTIQRDITEMLAREFPEVASTLNRELDSTLSKLNLAGYVSFGGGKRRTVKKEEIWDEKKAMETIKNS